MGIFRTWRRTRQDLSGLLDEARTREPPLGAGDVPLELSLVGRSSSLIQAAPFAALSISLVVYQVILGFGVGLYTLLLIAGHILLVVAAGLPDLTALNRRLIISGQGVRLEKIHRAYTIPWWQMRFVEAKNDLSTIRVIGETARITIEGSALDTGARKAIIFGIRARQPPLVISDWPKAGRLIANARSGAFGIAGVALIVAGTFIGFRGVALGVRCSVSSQYLQQRFNLPERQGCVVLRVSAGAEKAGIEQGDLIIALGDTPVTSGTQFTILFEGQRRRTWTFTVIRPGEPEPLTFQVKSAERRRFEEDPNDPIFYYLRARSNAGEKPEQAIQDYIRVIELEPRFDLAYCAQLYDEVGEYALAENDYLNALELSPRLGEAHRLTGQHERRRDITAAQFRARKAIQLDMCEGAFERYNVDCANDYYLLAILQVNYIDLNGPIATAEQAVRFWPEAVEAYYVLATLYERIGDTSTAAKYAEHYLEFPEEDRFSENEADAKRIRDLAK